MSPDLIVVRHSSPGVPHLLARHLRAGRRRIFRQPAADVLRDVGAVLLEHHHVAVAADAHVGEADEVVAGWLASLLPGIRAYRLSLADGLSPRI